MNWTPGTWADVAIGDDVLGADGYPWRVTEVEKRYAPNGDEYRAVEMERDGRAPVRASVLADKAVKYRKALITVTRLGPPLTVIVDADDLALGEAMRRAIMREPAPATEREAWIQREAEETGEPIEDVRALLDDVDPVAPAVITEPKPYVEYDDAERAAAAALKGAGLAMTVIERQMTLDGLTEHIGNVHGEPLPGAGGNLTRIELRSRLADLHFLLHEADQARGQRWEPRGSTAHVHPVMDRPTGDPEPTSFRAKR